MNVKKHDENLIQQIEILNSDFLFLSRMKKSFILFFLVTGILASSANKLPWATITNGNAYWAEVLGVQPTEPRQKTVSEIVNKNVCY